MLPLDGKVAIVTGGARGQGAAEARMIVEAGGRVLIGDLLDDQGQALARDLGPAGHFQHLDVTDEHSWIGALAAAQNRFGALDLLINNAGYSTTTPVGEVTGEELDRVYAINQRGVALGMRHCSNAMRDPNATKAAGGAIVNIASWAGLRPMRGKIAYGGAKAAVIMMTGIAALELAAHRIRVNAILPGIVNTQMVASATPEAVAAAIRATPLNRMGEPEDIARLAIFLLSDQASFITGAVVPVDGGASLL